MEDTDFPACSDSVIEEVEVETGCADHTDFDHWSSDLTAEQQQSMAQ